MQILTIYKKGFTLVEALVAIAILLLVIIGPMTIAQKGIQNARYAREQMTAIFLAQEAIEGVRQIRDEIGLRVYTGDEPTLDTTEWIQNAHEMCGSGCAFVVGDYSAQLSLCSGASGCKLYIDSDTGDYTHTEAGNYESPYTRVITIGAPDAINNSVPVNVEVSWYGQVFKSTRTVFLQTWIYDHYERYEGNI